ncbi:MAG TPA: NAD(P)/FAD-dependent oxidoreductase [Gaiellaceae bacterium]|nr:NAD(P)/FAD-dependent oxidoreductase [Gaiellaceae bacterium]
MARTALMRTLQKIAADCREADRRKVPVELLDEIRAEESSRLTRRDLIKRAGVAGAAATFGPAAFAGAAKADTGSGKTRKPTIAIVGGGIAGMSAALTLSDAGLASTVYEASDRIGGRMHSDTTGYWQNGQTSEWCGELIDTGHETILALADRFGLATVNLPDAQPAGATDTYFFNRHYYSVAQATSDFAPVQSALDDDTTAADYPTTYNNSTHAGRALDNMSVYDWISSRVPGGHSSPMGQLLDVAYGEEYGADTNVQSALNIVYLLGYQPVEGEFSIFGASDEVFHIIGGNEQLPNAIASSLPDGSVQTGWQLARIVANRDGSSTLTFNTGHRTQTVTADQVILCMSFPALQNVDYSRANFNPLKQTAITQLGAGRNVKLQLQFQNRYWNGHGPWGVSSGGSYSDTGAVNTWDVTRGQPGSTGILVDYTGGSIAGGFHPNTPYSNASSNPAVTGYAQSFLRQIESVYPGISRQWNGKATLSVPALDPNLGLSYSYWKVGQYQSFSGYEGVRQGNIHFAGEHCSQDFQGFMEGGASEGVRAAQEILDDLSMPSHHRGHGPHRDRWNDTRRVTRR